MANIVDQILKRTRERQAAQAPVKTASFEQQMLAVSHPEKAAAAAQAEPHSPHAIFTQYAPLIHREVNRWSASGLPKVVLEAEAKRLIIRALPLYNPGKNSNLTVHLTNHLKKLDAFVNTYKPDVRISLDKTYMQNKTIAAQTSLRLELGAEPTHDQIAARLGVTPASLGSLHRFQSNLYSKVEEGGFAQPVQENVGQGALVMDFLHHDLSPLHKVVFAHTVGYNGAPVLTAQELSAQLNIPAARVQKLRTDIAQQMQRYNHAVGSLSA